MSCLPVELECSGNREIVEVDPEVQRNGTFVSGKGDFHEKVDFFVFGVHIPVWNDFDREFSGCDVKGTVEGFATDFQRVGIAAAYGIV